MGETTNIHRELIRIETDRSSANQTAQTAESIRNKVGEMRDAFRSLGRDLGTTDDRLSRYGRSAAAAGARIDNMASELTDLRRAALEADKGVRTLAQSQDQLANKKLEQARLYGDVESRTRAITGAVGYIGGGSIERTANIGAELLAVNEAAGLLRRELPELVAGLELTRGKVLALGAAGGALALLGVAYSAYLKSKAEEKRALEQVTKATKDYYVSLQDMFTFLQDASSEDIESRIEQEKKRRAVALQIAGEVNQRVDEITEQLQGVFMGFEIPQGLAPQELLDIIESMDISGLASKQAAELRGLVSVYTEQDKIIQDVRLNLGLLNDAQMATGETFTNAGNTITSAVQDTFSTMLTTSQYVLPQITEAWDRLIKGGDSPLGKIGTALAGTFDAIAPAVEKLSQWYAEFNKTADLAAKTTAKLADELAEFERSAARAAADFALSRSRDLADQYTRLAALDADYYRNREDILAGLSSDLSGIDTEKLNAARDQNRELERLARDHRDRMAQIERDSRRDMLSAARKLDGIAAYDARIAKQDALEDENDQYDKEKDQREEDYRDRLREFAQQRLERQAAGMQALRDLEEQHNRERAEQVREFAMKLQREDQDRAIRMAREQEDFLRKRNAQLVQYATEQGMTAAHFSTVNAITSAGMSMVSNTILQGWAALQSQLGGGSGGIVQGQINTILGAIGGALGTTNHINVNSNASKDTVREILNGALLELAG